MSKRRDKLKEAMKIKKDWDMNVDINKLKS